jgi:hypothetical protein
VAGPGEGIDAFEIQSKLLSHAKSLGIFDRVLGHEPKNKPGRGLTYAVWLNRIEPARGRSGLRYTDVRVEYFGRIYANMLQEPQDDFDLGKEDRFIDLLGITQRDPLKCESGYINIDSFVYRVFTFVLPVIEPNVWEQVK